MYTILCRHVLNLEVVVTSLNIFWGYYPLNLLDIRDTKTRGRPCAHGALSPVGAVEKHRRGAFRGGQLGKSGLATQGSPGTMTTVLWSRNKQLSATKRSNQGNRLLLSKLQEICFFFFPHVFAPDIFLLDYILISLLGSHASASLKGQNIISKWETALGNTSLSRLPKLKW